MHDFLSSKFEAHPVRVALNRPIPQEPCKLRVLIQNLEEVGAFDVVALHLHLVVRTFHGSVRDVGIVRHTVKQQGALAKEALHAQLCQSIKLLLLDTSRSLDRRDQHLIRLDKEDGGCSLALVDDRRPRLVESVPQLSDEPHHDLLVRLVASLEVIKKVLHELNLLVEADLSEVLLESRRQSPKEFIFVEGVDR